MIIGRRLRLPPPSSRTPAPGKGNKATQARRSHIAQRLRGEPQQEKTIEAHRLGTRPKLLRPWIHTSYRQAAKEEHGSIHPATSNPNTSLYSKPHSLFTNSAGQTARRETTPVQKLTGAEATTGPPDPEANDLTSLSPMPEDATARWRRSRRTLFHHSSSTSTLRSPPGDTNLDKLGPTLHSRAENHPFPSHPRPTRPPEARKNGGLAGWSTRFSRRLRSRREKGRGFERKAATISEVLALSCVGFQRCVVR